MQESKYPTEFLSNIDRYIPFRVVTIFGGGGATSTDSGANDGADCTL